MLSHRAATAAQDIRGLAWCCTAVFGALVVPQQAALAQDAPRLVCVATAGAAMRDFAGGVLIAAERGVYLAGPAAGAKGCEGR